MNSYAWKFSRPAQLFFSDLEDTGRRVSHSFAGQFPIFFGLCWSGFVFNFSDALFSPCTVCSLQQWPVIFYLMKGHFPFFSRLKSSTSPPCANGVARAWLGCKYPNYTSKVNNTVDFQVSSNWKPEGRILNRALAVYYLANQGTQRAQIALHKMNT